jgi:hypothetical protein
MHRRFVFVASARWFPSGKHLPGLIFPGFPDGKQVVKYSKIAEKKDVATTGQPRKDFREIFAILLIKRRTIPIWTTGGTYECFRFCDSDGRRWQEIL